MTQALESKTDDISDVIALVDQKEIEDTSVRVDRLLTNQNVSREPMNMIAFD